MGLIADNSIDSKDLWLTIDSPKTRCAWVGEEPLYQSYHDEEWGTPCHDDTTLFEFLILEGAQAGLSWITILRKREHYQRVFDRFDAKKIARYDNAKIERLLQDPGIVRNRLKVNAAVSNAQAFLQILEEGRSFSEYLWDFVDGKPLQNHWERLDQVPASTPLSDKLSKDLKRRGFKFVGTTICYAYMQAVGLVNDHTIGCFRHREILRQYPD
jgi:DNA-3-methyladenine glycosylase I